MNVKFLSRMFFLIGALAIAQAVYAENAPQESQELQESIEASVVLQDVLEGLKEQKPWWADALPVSLVMLAAGAVIGLGVDMASFPPTAPRYMYGGLIPGYVAALMALCLEETPQAQPLKLITRFGYILKDQTVKNLKLSPTMDDAVAFAQHNFNDLTALFSAWNYLANLTLKLDALLGRARNALVACSNEKTAQNYDMLVQALELSTKAIKAYMEHIENHPDFARHAEIYTDSIAYRKVYAEIERLRYS